MAEVVQRRQGQERMAQALPLGRRVPRGRLRWYLAACPEGHEAETCARVRQIVGADIIDDAFVPRVERIKKIDGQWSAVTRPLFKGYFVIATKDATVLSAALSKLSFSVHLAGAVGRGYAPVDEEARLFLESCMDGTHTIRSSEAEIIADELRVLRGPLVGRESRVSHVNRRKCLATVSASDEANAFSLTVPLAIPVRR